MRVCGCRSARGLLGGRGACFWPSVGQTCSSSSSSYFSERTVRWIVGDSSSGYASSGKSAALHASPLFELRPFAPPLIQLPAQQLGLSWRWKLAFFPPCLCCSAARTGAKSGWMWMFSFRTDADCFQVKKKKKISRHSRSISYSMWE